MFGPQTTQSEGQQLLISEERSPSPEEAHRMQQEAAADSTETDTTTLPFQTGKIVVFSCVFHTLKFGPPYPGKTAAAARAALPNPTSVCWVFSWHRTLAWTRWSLLCVRIHTGVGHTNSELAQHFWLGKTLSKKIVLLTQAGFKPPIFGSRVWRSNKFILGSLIIRRCLCVCVCMCVCVCVRACVCCGSGCFCCLETTAHGVSNYVFSLEISYFEEKGTLLLDTSFR